ncbi:MAG: hypothetical protein KatS3mg105_5014 [Gemmatales bacterium]|jgi:hypothetical protein|nr:MAG: hypothetical protein KatS3mg105_5014 [Gemmatales bacterium]
MSDSLDNEALARAALEPKSASSEAGSVQAHDLSQVIEVLNRQLAIEALKGANRQGGPKSGWSLLRVAFGKPPGAV